MTQTEKTGIRELNFSGWIRQNLPDSKTGFMVSDIDFVIYNYKTKKIAIVEVKTRNADLKDWQKMFYRMLHKVFTNGVCDGWKYKGVYVIQFENTFFTDGKCFLNYNEITEDELIKILSL